MAVASNARCVRCLDRENFIGRYRFFQKVVGLRGLILKRSRLCCFWLILRGACAFGRILANKAGALIPINAPAPTLENFLFQHIILFLKNFRNDHASWAVAVFRSSGLDFFCMGCHIFRIIAKDFRTSIRFCKSD